MPLRQSYKDGLKSLLADMKNTDPQPGGSITAALFLKEFVAKDTARAHIDIAGPVWSDKGKVNPAGATGYGVRTLGELGDGPGMSRSSRALVHQGSAGGTAASSRPLPVRRSNQPQGGSDAGKGWRSLVLVWHLSLICINAGIGLMIDSGLTRGYPGRRQG